MTQCDRIVEYMDQFGGISQRQATRDLGITRLAARIFNLREQGYVIENVKRKGVNRWGEPMRYVEYRLIKKPDRHTQTKDDRAIRLNKDIIHRSEAEIKCQK